MQFAKVTGQHSIKAQLVNMVKENRLSHALLFLSNEGSGGLLLAQAFAQYLICEKVSRGETTGMFGDTLFDTAEIETVFPDDSCGVCSACKKAAEWIHPDIHFSYPVVVKKQGEAPISTDYINEWRQFLQQQPYGNAYDWLQFIGAENKQGNITVKECNDIIHKISLKSFESRYKILIMWMPEALGKEGNILLKLMEEPPPDTLFILVAENQAQILPTILSRTQLIRIPALRRKDVEAQLLASGVEEAKAKQIATVSGGNFHEALNILQNPEDDWEVVLRDWLNTIVRTGPVAQVKWIDDISKTGREKQKQFLKYFSNILHHAIRINILGVEILSQNENDTTTDFAIRINKIMALPQQEAIVKELDKATYYIERNANPKLLFHALTIRLYHIISNKTLILIS